MPEETDYHGWVKPDDGMEDWGDYYRNFLDELDRFAFQTGPRSDRPSTAPDRAFWYDNENEILYQYNGTDGAWEARGSHWQDYELVFDDDEPETDRYIRIETE